MNEWMVIVGGPILFSIWLAIFMRWQRGMMWLLAFIPFAGLPVLFLGHAEVTLILKDIVFVIPVYLVLFTFGLKQLGNADVPKWLGAMMLILASLVLIQSLNPAIPNIMVAVIGAKVWLFYMPLVLVGAAMIAQPDDLVRIHRLMVVLAIIPTTVGLIEWVGSAIIGYEATMVGIYGAKAAYAATQELTSFEYGAAGAGEFFRIPSTFSFPTQYFGYLISMIPASYVLSVIDPSPKWRRFGQLMIYYVALGAFFSGSRQAFAFVPFTIALLYLFDGRITGFAAGVVVLPLALYAALNIAGIDPITLYGKTQQLAGTYGEEFIFSSPIKALDEFPLGTGTGMNTGPARYAFPGTPFIATLDYNPESYYTKAITELGALGLVCVFGMFLAVILTALRTRWLVKIPSLKSVASAYGTFAIVIMINSIKGWQMDLDPINVYFWLFAGFVFKLPHIERIAVPRRVVAPPPRMRAIGRAPVMRGPAPWRPR